MFNKLVDLVIEFMSLFQLFVFVDEFEKGVVLRLGRFHRTVDPGLRWILPLGLEEVLVDNSKPAPMYLDVQSLHTKDDEQCNIQVGVIWRITDIRLFLVETEDAEDMVGMLCSGVVAASVQARNWDEIREEDYPEQLWGPMNEKVKQIGAEIGEVVIQDLATGEANRIWHEGVSLDFGFDED